MVEPLLLSTLFQDARMILANSAIQMRCDTAIRDGLDLIPFFEAEALWDLAVVSRSIVDRLRRCDFHAAWELLGSIDLDSRTPSMRASERHNHASERLISLRCLVQFLMTNDQEVTI